MQNMRQHAWGSGRPLGTFLFIQLLVGVSVGFMGSLSVSKSSLNIYWKHDSILGSIPLQAFKFIFCKE
eukprot:c5553_g1_i1 orf=273-476(+)